MKGLNKSDPNVNFENNLEGQTRCPNVSKGVVGMFPLSLKKERGNSALDQKMLPLDLNTFFFLNIYLFVWKGGGRGRERERETPKQVPR